MEEEYTSEGRDIMDKPGYLTYYHRNFIRVVYGRYKFALTMILVLAGLLGSTTWFIMSVLASTPTAPSLPLTTDLAMNFTIFSAVMVGLFVFTLLAFWWMMKSSSATHELKGTHLMSSDARKKEKSNKWSTWSMIGIGNRQKIKFATLLQIMAYIGLIYLNVSFLAIQAEPFNTYFTDVMLTNGSVTQITASPNSTDTCQQATAFYCNSNTSYTYDDVTAQTFINVQHGNTVFTWILMLAYFIQLQAFWWLEVNISVAPPSAGSGRLTSISDLNFYIGSESKAKENDLSPQDGEGRTPSPVWVVIPQSCARKSTGPGAYDDGTLLAVVIIIGVGLFSIWFMSLFWMLAEAGIYKGFCSGFYAYPGLWIIYYCVFWAMIIALVFALIGVMLKDILQKDTTAGQYYKLFTSVIFLSIIGILGVVIGALWIGSHGDGVTFSVPLAILCRINPYWRTYNALKIFENTVFYLALFVLGDYFFLHKFCIGKIYLIGGQHKKKER